MKLKIIFFCNLLFLLSCNTNENVQTKSEAQRADSLSEKLNSPELKTVNEELLNNPSSADLYDKRAKVYLNLRQFDEAVYDSQRAIKLDSANENYYLTLVDVYFGRNNTKKAKDLLEIIEIRFPKNVEALLKLSELYFLVKQYQKGIDYANKALKLDENMARAYYLKGSIYRESGDTTKAISSLVTAVEQDNRYEDAFYDLGIIYAARKNPLAFEYYNNALKINPKSLNALYAHAKLQQDLGKTDEALKEYDQILAQGLACENCAYNMGAIYLEIKLDNIKALEKFSKAIELNPNYTEAYFARGYTYYKLKDRKKARADLISCIKLDSSHDPAIELLNNL